MQVKGRQMKLTCQRQWFIGKTTEYEIVVDLCHCVSWWMHSVCPVLCVPTREEFSVLLDIIIIAKKRKENSWTISGETIKRWSVPIRRQLSTTSGRRPMDRSGWSTWVTMWPILNKQIQSDYTVYIFTFALFIPFWLYLPWWSAVRIIENCWSCWVYFFDAVGLVDAVASYLTVTSMVRW